MMGLIVELYVIRMMEVMLVVFLIENLELNRIKVKMMMFGV